MIKPRAYPLTVQRIAVLAMLSAITHVSRLAFGFLPNVQPVTVIVLFICLTFGLVDAWIVSSLSIVLSNLTLGMGPWTVAQVGAYFILLFCTDLIQKGLKRPPSLRGCLYAGMVGYFYGVLVTLFQAPFLGMSWQAAVGYWTAGLPFDTYHALGNSLFYLILAPVLIPLFEKTAKKLKKESQ